MRLDWIRWVPALALGWVVGSAAAQPAIDGAQPHPLVPPPANATITYDETTDFAVVEFPAGLLDRREFTETLSVEGDYRIVEYTLEGTEIGGLRLYRTYLQHLEQNGYEIVFTGFGEELGSREGYNFALRNPMFRQPGAAPASIGYILARSEDGNTVLSTATYVRQGDRRIMVHSVEVEELEPLDLLAVAPESPAEPEAATEQPPESLTSAEVAALQQDVTELESGLVQDGRVTVTAILFAFDRADILPESAQALGTVASLLNDNPELSLLVVGHTDGVGAFDYNLKLSLERASAVVDWLIERQGIAADRLRPAGAGPMSPVTTNRTEEGRAQNRRVELVEVVR